MTSVDFGIDTRHVKFPLITQQSSYTWYGFGLNVSNRVSKIRNSVLNRLGKSAIFAAWPSYPGRAEQHLPTQRYIEYFPRETLNNFPLLRNFNSSNCHSLFSTYFSQCFSLLTNTMLGPGPYTNPMLVPVSDREKKPLKQYGMSKYIQLF